MIQPHECTSSVDPVMEKSFARNGRVDVADYVLKTVEFGEGPLGLIISEVNRNGGKSITVTAFEETRSPQCSLVDVGDELLSINGASCVGSSIMEVFKMVKQTPRPLRLTFRKAIENSSIECESASSTSLSSDATVDRWGHLVNKMLRIRNADRRMAMLKGQGDSDKMILKQRLSPRSRKKIKKLQSFKSSDQQDHSNHNVVHVEFGEGPLGMKISDIGTSVLVTSFESANGQIGQAEASKKIKFGARVISINDVDCKGKDMKQIYKLVRETPRPITVGFSYPKRFANSPYNSPCSSPSAANSPKEFCSSPTTFRCKKCLEYQQKNKKETDPMLFHFNILTKSVKIDMQLNATSNDIEYLNDIDIDSLYMKAIDENVPFFKWSHWIRTQFTHLKVDAMMNDGLPPKPTVDDEPENLDATIDPECDACFARLNNTNLTILSSDVQEEEDDEESPTDLMFFHFHMLCQTLKISRETSGESNDYSIADLPVNEQDMYKQVLADGAPIHEWSNWIKNHINNVYVDSLYTLHVDPDSLQNPFHKPSSLSSSKGTESKKDFLKVDLRDILGKSKSKDDNSSVCSSQAA